MKHFYIPFVMLMIALTGCSTPKPDPAKVAETIRLYADTSIERAFFEDPEIFNDSPFKPLVDLAFEKERITPPHFVNIINHGDDAFISRIHLIRSAQKTILFQTFIWQNDESANFFFRELLIAARRGVKIKIIVDQLGIRHNNETSALAVLSHSNVEFKVYNPTYDKAQSSTIDLARAGIVQFGDVNQRMHNKVLIIDNMIAITGGRNIGNKYFDLAPDYTFKDRDILVIGRTLEKMVYSFYEYWNYDKTVYLSELHDVALELTEIQSIPAVAKFIDAPINPVLKDFDRLASDDDYIQKNFIDNVFEVKGRIAFVADEPGKTENDDPKSKSTDSDAEKAIYSAETSLIIQTPYLVFSKAALKGLKKLRKHNPDFKIIASTNSLPAADHMAVYSIAYKQKKKLVKNLKFNIYELKPTPEDVHDMVRRYDILTQKKIAMGKSDDGSIISETKGPVVGIHAKSFVIDSKIAWIGSHNFDPRSANYNTELAVIIWDEAVAKALEENILRDTLPENSWLISRKRQVPIISYFSGIIGSISRALPVFDIWPFRYCTSYELNEGMEPVSRNHPDFWKHYKDMGAFPGINMSAKAMQARLTTAMGGFAIPII
ncbi:MAG: phospholipase D family protein [Desulfobacterales bacterium]|nr:phospholipase D family protein [Desulfobacterales bacterium]